MNRIDKHMLLVPGDDRLGLIVNLPPAIKGRSINGLPPYAPVIGYDVDKYPAAPESWPRTEGTTAGYFIAVEDGKGMWLDFNMCARHRHHVAVVISIQGVNPLTGRKTDKRELERYADDPSVEPWLRGYQNYLATTCTPNGLLWIDGFRAQDGTVRQYVFTKDESKGVAAQLIGVNRVFAIGVSFFLSKEPKPEPKTIIREMSFGATKGGGGGLLGSKGIGGQAVWIAHQSSSMDADDTPIGASLNFCSTDTGSKGITGANGPAGIEGKLMSYVDEERSSRKLSVKGRSVIQSRSEPSRQLYSGRVQEVDRLEISAGAQISQQLYKDAVEMSFWNPEPFGTVVVNYAPKELVDQILSAGETPSAEGFLDSIETGNDV
jgi:hypothetical protein